MSTRPKPLVQLILDGCGYRLEENYNAMTHSNTPCWDRLRAVIPMALWNCFGSVVGLPNDQLGNSEVGHLHIGSSRYMSQDLFRMNHAI